MQYSQVSHSKSSGRGKSHSCLFSEVQHTLPRSLRHSKAQSSRLPQHRASWCQAVTKHQSSIPLCTKPAPKHYYTASHGNKARSILQHINTARFPSPPLYRVSPPSSQVSFALQHSILPLLPVLPGTERLPVVFMHPHP